VPAEEAVIPIRDRLCCRIGNADDQEHNLSTFMLEMKETAFICSHATSRSLVLVDELGRATSNEDGVAIAWATAEHLLKKRAMTFFVTHYPQISCLASIYPSVQNIHLEASVSQNSDEGIRYTHKVKPGACSISTDYGVELAAACGWPSDVVADARDIQEDVKTRLPNENFCQNRSLDQFSDPTQTLAFQSLDNCCAELQQLLRDDQEEQTYSALRAELTKLADKYKDDQGLAALIRSSSSHQVESPYRVNNNNEDQSSIGTRTLETVAAETHASGKMNEAGSSPSSSSSGDSSSDDGSSTSTSSSDDDASSTSDGHDATSKDVGRAMR
jgi:MutS domain V